MGKKRVKEILSKYKNIKTIAGLKPEVLKKELGFPVTIAEAIIELAIKKS
jgi:hypothetical protein